MREREVVNLLQLCKHSREIVVSLFSELRIFQAFYFESVIHIRPYFKGAIYCFYFWVFLNTVRLRLIATWLINVSLLRRILSGDNCLPTSVFPQLRLTDSCWCEYFFVEQVGSDNYDLIFCVRSHIPIIAAASRGNDRNRRHKTESKMLRAIQETWRRVQSHVRIRHWARNRVWYLHGKEPENCSPGLQPCHVPHLLPRLVRPSLSLANLQILGLAAFEGWR